MVAPIWGGAGGGSAMGSADDRKRFLDQVRKACVIGKQEAQPRLLDNVWPTLQPLLRR